MKIFEVIEDRSVDPVDLATRTGKRYGKEKDYGYSQSDTNPGEYIPLKNYNDDWVDAMEEVFNEIYKTLDFYNLSRDKQIQIRQKLDNEAKSVKSVPINKLYATQPFVRIKDKETLKNKVATTKQITVIDFADRLFIRDGHHAVLAARLRGEKTIQAKVINLDYLEEKYL